MSPQQIQTAALPIAAGLFALALALFLLSLRYFRRSRTDSYWRRRRTAGQRGWRLFVWSIIFTLFSGVLCMASGIAGIIVNRNSTPTIVVVIATSPPTNTTAPKSTVIATATTPKGTTQVPTKIITAASTITSTATRVTATVSKATSTSTPTQTAARTKAVTPTNTATLTPRATSSLQSSVTPGPDAKLSITALDTQISAAFGPVAPGNEFAAGFNRIYYFVTFSGMQSGVLWKRQLLRDGKVIDDTAYLWGLAQEGTGYFFFGQEGGFKPGNYEIRLFIGDTENPAISAAFTVK